MCTGGLYDLHLPYNGLWALASTGCGPWAVAALFHPSNPPSPVDMMGEEAEECKVEGGPDATHQLAHVLVSWVDLHQTNLAHALLIHTLL